MNAEPSGNLPGCLPYAQTMEEAFNNAKEALQLHIFGMEEDNEDIPSPSSVASMQLNAGDSLAMIEAWMPPFREKMSNKSTSKTVTIPRWLDTLARLKILSWS